jgi:hypothetical protein
MIPAVYNANRGALETRLREPVGRMLPAADEPDVVRFEDNNGSSSR